MSLSLDPLPFKENAVEGADLLEVRTRRRLPPAKAGERGTHAPPACCTARHRGAADRVQLTDEELQDFLKLKPLQVKKIRRKLNELLEEEQGGAPRPAATAPAVSAARATYDDEGEETTGKVRARRRFAKERARRTLMRRARIEGVVAARASLPSTSTTWYVRRPRLTAWGRGPSEAAR